jgi:hypothetical protein
MGVKGMLGLPLALCAPAADDKIDTAKRKWAGTIDSILMEEHDSR